MIVVPCLRCFHAVRVNGDDTEITMLVGQRSDFWPDKYVCPVCEQTCTAVLEEQFEPTDIIKFKLHDLEPAEAFRAFEGLGLPEELPAKEADVLRALSKPVRSLVGRPLPGNTVFLVEQLVMEDGTRIFLAASPQGAVIYRISPPVERTSP